MTTSQSNDCQIDDPNNLTPIAVESLRLPLDRSMRIVFTGYYNGYSVEVRSVDEIALLYHMGCFGKGSASRSKPRVAHNDGNPPIMRKRQFLKRNYWYKKFGCPIEKMSDSNLFLKDVDELAAKIISDAARQSNKDVIDLVSSEEDNGEVSDDTNSSNHMNSLQTQDNIVVIVPNSDSEGDNYFANLKPKCCLNRIRIQEKLMLTLQEAFFLLYGLGCLQIVNNDKSQNIRDCWQLFKETDKKFISKYVVYHYFRSKGYIVKPGIKFGGDYLLYKEGPGISHADYIVVIKSEQDDSMNDWISVLGLVRMATTTVKEVMIAEVIKPSKDPECLENLNSYSVREILLNRKIPVTVNNDID